MTDNDKIRDCFEKGLSAMNEKKYKQAASWYRKSYLYFEYSEEKLDDVALRLGKEADIRFHRIENRFLTKADAIAVNDEPHEYLLR